MLFTSFPFIFCFVPLGLCIFYLIITFSLRAVAKIFLIIASLVFYGWNIQSAILVLLLSTFFTYYSVKLIDLWDSKPLFRKIAFGFGLFSSLGNLIFWKYTNFSLLTINSIFNSDYPLLELAIPLGISFYTFQQLTYVIDNYSRQVSPGISLLDYVLYVVFFPQLVVGPIVRYDELVPQLESKSFGKFHVHNLIIGFTVFSVGLAKKVLIADNLSILVDPSFLSISLGFDIPFIQAWVAAFAFALQLYFDFSGYSDMALGTARMFGLRLPINFHSPLKCQSTLDFWRRWHITLTRMTTKYVFSPISVSATRYSATHQIKGFAKTFVMVFPACLITFLLIGFWHGATYVFLLFGLIHTIYAIVDYSWRMYKPKAIISILPLPLRSLFGRLMSLILIVVSLVLFKSKDIEGFVRFLGSMFVLPNFDNFHLYINHLSIFNLLLFLTALSISQFAPNTQQIFSRYNPGIFTYVEHSRDVINSPPRIDFKLSLSLGILFALSLAYLAIGVPDFLYLGF